MANPIGAGHTQEHRNGESRTKRLAATAVKGGVGSRRAPDGLTQQPNSAKCERTCDMVVTKAAPVTTIGSKLGTYI